MPDLTVSVQADPAPVSVRVDAQRAPERVVVSTGVPGPPGPPGRPTAAGVFLPQLLPLAVWVFTVPPGFRRPPAVMLLDPNGVQYLADTTSTTELVTVQHPSPCTGGVILT